MRKAKEISESLLSLVNEAIEERRRIDERLSEVDLMINSITHEIELVRLNAIQAYKVTVRLQELLRERREIKRERQALQSLYDSIHNHNLLPVIKKVESSVRSAVDRDIAGAEDRGVIKSILGAKKVAMI